MYIKIQIIVPLLVVNFPLIHLVSSAKNLLLVSGNTSDFSSTTLRWTVTLPTIEHGLRFARLARQCNNLWRRRRFDYLKNNPIDGTLQEGNSVDTTNVYILWVSLLVSFVYLSLKQLRKKSSRKTRFWIGFYKIPEKINNLQSFWKSKPK